jgi:hypothetical protein
VEFVNTDIEQVELLLYDCEMGRYSRVVSGQQLSKHVPAATDMNATIEELCFLCGLCQDVIRKGQGQFSQFCMGSVKR